MKMEIYNLHNTNGRFQEDVYNYFNAEHQRILQSITEEHKKEIDTVKSAHEAKIKELHNKFLDNEVSNTSVAVAWSDLPHKAKRRMEQDQQVKDINDAVAKKADEAIAEAVEQKEVEIRTVWEQLEVPKMIIFIIRIVTG